MILAMTGHTEVIPGQKPRFWTARANSMHPRRISRGDEARLLPGKIKGGVDKSFPLREAAAAHQRLEKSEQFGKVILNS